MQTLQPTQLTHSVHASFCVPKLIIRRTSTRAWVATQSRSPSVEGGCLKVMEEEFPAPFCRRFRRRWLARVTWLRPWLNRLCSPFQSHTHISSQSCSAHNSFMARFLEYPNARVITNLEGMASEGKRKVPRQLQSCSGSAWNGIGNETESNEIWNGKCWSNCRAAEKV